MFMKLSKRDGQTIAEYAVLIAIVVGAIVTMQVYVKRGFQGKIKDAVDYTGDTAGTTVGTDTFTFSADQYEPYYTVSEAKSVSKSQAQEVLGKQGESGRASAQKTVQSREQVLGWNAGETVSATDVDEGSADVSDIIPDAPQVDTYQK